MANKLNNNQFIDYVALYRQKHGQPEQEETGYLDALMRGGKSTAQSIVGSIGGLVGADEFARNMQQYANDNARRRQHDTVFSWDYITDPEGLAYDVGGNLGSMAALAPLALAVPQSAALAGAGLIGRGLGGVGLKKAANWALSEAGKKALATGIRGAATGIGEAASEWGSAYQEAKEQGVENPRLDTLDVFAKNLALSPVMNAIEYGTTLGGLGGMTAKAGEGLAKRAALAPFRAAPAIGTNAIQNGIEELMQTTITAQSLGKPYGNPFVPSEWTDEQRQSFEVGLATGGVTAGVPNVGRALMPYEEKAEEQQEEQKQETSSDKVVNDYLEKAEQEVQQQRKELAEVNDRADKLMLEASKNQTTKQQVINKILDRIERNTPSAIGTNVKANRNASEGVRDYVKGRQYDRFRGINSLSDNELLEEIRNTKDNVYRQGLLTEARKRGLNVGEGFNFTKPSNIVPMSTIRQEEGEKQRQQTSSVTHDADNLLLQATMEQPKMQKPQRGLSIVNRGEVGSVNQQREYAEAPTTEGRYLRNYEQELVDKYIGNPQLFERDYFSAQNAVKRAFKNGDLTKEEAETNLNNLRGLYDRTAQAIRNNGVIRQTGFKKPRNIKNIISEARQKQKNEMGKIAKAANDVKLRNIVEKGVKTKIQVPFYIQNAVREIQEIKQAKADEQRRQQVFDEMKQGATEYINSIDAEARQEVISASLEEARNGRKELFTSLVNKLKEGMGHGVTRQYTDKETGEVADVSDLKGKEETSKNSASYNREVYSNNAPWYQNWFKSNGRKPNNVELYEIAENIYLGNDEYGSGLLPFDGSKEADEALAQNKANVEYFDNLIKIYEELQNGEKQADVTAEQPRQTAQDKPQQEQKAEPKEVVAEDKKEPVNEDVASDVEKKAETKKVASEATKEEQPRSDGRLVKPITKPVNKGVELPKAELPQKTIKVSGNQTVATLDKNGTVTITVDRKNDTDNLFQFKFNIDEYRKAALETSNPEASTRRYILGFADKAVKEWIENAPSEKIKKARQKQYDFLGANPFANVANILTRKLLEKAGIKVPSAMDIYNERKASQATTLKQEENKNKPTQTTTSTKEAKADVDDLKYLSKEGKEVYQKVVDVLKTGNDKVSNAAEMGALIYARRADNYAEAMRKAGNKDYTALDYLNDNPVQIGGETNKESLKQNNVFGVSNEIFEKQKEAVRKKYKNTKEWLKAPNGEDTNLTEEQWLIVRTPAFKNWFGNWNYDTKIPVEFVDLTGVKIEDNGIEVNVKDTKALNRWLVNALRNKSVDIDDSGTTVYFAKKGLNDGVTKARIKKGQTDVNRTLYAKIEELIKKSIYVDYRVSDEDHQVNTKGQERYVNGIKINTENGTVYYRVEFVVDVKKDFARNYKGHQAHIIKIEPIVYYTTSAESLALRDKTKSYTRLDPIVSPILSDLATGVNLEHSKILDENGEPLVVYHGTEEDFDVFDRTKSRANMDIQGNFFSPWEIDAQGYGSNVRAFWLNIRNPASSSVGYKALNMFKGQNGAGIKAREYLIEQGYDGVNNDDEEYIAFESEQIKSVDNQGTFDADNPNVYKQTAYHGTPYKFDKFDLGSVGTGEGAQVHGWGLYFAQDKTIAENYQNQFAYEEVGRILKKLNPQSKEFDIMQQVYGFYESLVLGDSREDVMQEIEEEPEAFYPEAIKRFKEERYGNIYEVDVPNNDVLLEENKKFKQQSPNVQTSIINLIKALSPKETEKLADESYANIKDATTTSQLKQAIIERVEKIDGQDFYNYLSHALGGDRKASLLLNKYGIKGIAYNGGKDGRCFVVFDDEAISIINRYNQMAQDETQTVKGETTIIGDGKKVVKLFKSADESTFVHEIGHVAYADLQEQASMEDAPEQIKQDLKTVDDWAEWKDGQLSEYEGTAVYEEFKKRDAAIREAIKNGDNAKADKLKYQWKQERFARGFEEYLRQGNAPTNALKKVFQKFKEWLVEIYQGYKAIGAVPSKEVQAVMDRLLMAKGETKTADKKFSITESEEWTQTKDELYDSLEDIFGEGSKAEEIAPDEWIVTVPNGKRILIKIKDEIIFNEEELAQGKKEHGFADNANVEVSGYWQRLTKDDVADGELVLSLRSPKGIAYHEILHAVMDLALTKKEKAALIKSAMKEAKETGKDVEEVIAERYRKWVLARKRGEGTAWGKLFKKMQDFYYKLKKLFTGIENAHNVMRKIESREVWTRDGRRVVGKKGKRLLVAYHGTPHEFTTFSTDYVGTGEGNIAHGWGLYFAEKKQVAEGYKEALTNTDESNFPYSIKIGNTMMYVKDPLLHTKTYVNGKEASQEVADALYDILNPIPTERGEHLYKGKISNIIKELEKSLISFPDDEYRKEKMSALKFLAKYGDDYIVYRKIPEGAVFKVDIPELEVMLDEQKTYSQQSSIVKKSLQALSEHLKEKYGKDLNLTNDESGEDIYSEITHIVGDAKQASLKLNNYGVKGITYDGLIDGRCFVVFDDRAIKVLENSNTPVRKYSITPSKNKIKGITVTTTPKTLKQQVKEQGYKGWFKGLWKDFYRNWVDKNDSLHALDEAMQMATGKPLAEKDKVYNRAQTMNATAAGRVQALIKGDGYHIKALSEQMGRKLHNVTLKKILEFISKDTMDKLFPNYLKDNDYDNWIDAFGHYLTARRLREMFRYQREVFEEKHAEWAKKKRVHEEWVRNGRQGKEPDKAGREPVYEPYKLPQDVTIEDIERAIKTAPAPFAEAAKMYYQFNDNLLTILEDAGIISKEVHELLNTKYREYCPLMRDFSDTAGADMFLNGLSNGGRGIANVSSTLKRISLEGSERGVINPLEVSVKSVAVMMNRAERNKVGQMAVRLAGEPGMENVIREIPTPRGGNAVADPKNSIFTVMINGKKVAYQCAPELYGAIVGYNVPTAGFVLGVARSTARMLRTGATMSPSFIIRNLIRDTIFAGISSKNGFIPIVDTIRGAQALMNNPELKAEFETAGVSAFNFYKNAETAYKSLVELNGGKELNMRNPIDLIKFIARNFEEFSAFAESATRMGEFKRAIEAGKSIEEATRDAKEITIDFSRSGVLGENVNLVVPFFNATIQGGDKLARLFKENPVGTAVNVAKYIVLPSMLLWCMNYDDEEYKELDPKVKMTHWILGDIRIPKPQEAGIMFGSGIEAMLDLAAGKDPQAMKHWAKQVIDGLLPNVLPTLILPLVEWQANYSFFRDGKLVGYREERLPDELQYKDSTSELSKGLGKLTGLSPIKLDNTVRGYTGTMGMLLWQAYDFTSMDKSKLPDKKLVELPLIRDFFVNDYNTRRSVDEFYKLAEQADKQHAGYGVKGKPNAVVQGIRKAKQQISNLNKDIRTITASNLSPVEKRERIDKKREYIKRIAQRANERYSKFYD